jgi:cell shape-determining protein MreD
VVVICGYLALGLELAVKPALALGPTKIAPSFLVPLVAYIALCGPLVPALWVALLLGAAVDLSSPRGDGTVFVLGPYALGYVAGAYLAHTMRGLMFRRSALSVMFLSVLAGLLAELVVVSLLTFRSVYSHDVPWSAGAELVKRVMSAGYTAITGLALGIVLVPMSSVFGFADPQSRRFSRRTM